MISKWLEISIGLVLLQLVSCSKHKGEPEDVLMIYGEETLTRKEVVDKIPQGLIEEDSIAMFNAIVESWIKDRVISDFAEQRLPDISVIERKVKDYRNSLIVEEYLSRMRETRTPKIDEQKVREYYDLHRKEMHLETPLLKGIFLKINSGTSGSAEIGALIMSDDPSKTDILEREWLDRAMEYNYFRDKWIDWETLKGMMPYRFGDPETFLSTTEFLETEYDDCTYFLRITDVLPAGEEQPYEYARGWILNLLTTGALADYEESLVSSLVEKAIKEKRLETPGYDPETHSVKETKTLLDQNNNR